MKTHADKRGDVMLAEEYYFYNTSLWNHPNDYDEDERPGFKGGNDVSYHMPKTNQLILLWSLIPQLECLK